MEDLNLPQGTLTQLESQGTHPSTSEAQALKVRSVCLSVCLSSLHLCLPGSPGLWVPAGDQFSACLSFHFIIPLCLLCGMFLFPEQFLLLFSPEGKEAEGIKGRNVPLNTVHLVGHTDSWSGDSEMRIRSTRIILLSFPQTTEVLLPLLPIPLSPCPRSRFRPFGCPGTTVAAFSPILSPLGPLQSTREPRSTSGPASVVLSAVPRPAASAAPENW